MTVPVIQSTFTLGEVAPALFGRADLARYHAACATFRNGFVNYRGGYNSRAGTKFVGFSKQTGRAYPPRLIPFQFNINQGLALEFGNFYMRVISNGAFVTESPFQITNITKSSPAVMTYQSLSTGATVSPNNSSVTSSYTRGDIITPAGGTAVVPASLQVVTTTVAKLSLLSGGSGYAIGDTLQLASNGVGSQVPIITVTGVSGGAVTTFAISNGGSFTTNGSGSFTQLSTSGAGTGATFLNAIFGPLVLNFFNTGEYSAVPANPVTQASTTGSGAGVTFTMTWNSPAALTGGDWLFITDVGGMTQVNGETYIAKNVTGTTLQLFDVYGNPVDSTSFSNYTSGGLAARVYTLMTPYSEADLEYLKFTQSADVMSLCCVNQQSGTEYPPQDLARLSDTNWTFTYVVPSQSVAPPASASGSASSSGGVDYQYVITAVSPDNGTESLASPIASITSAVNIAATAGTITLTWAAVAGVNQYNVYKATPAFGTLPPVGSLFGYAGTAYGTQFVDSNVTADFTQVPPLHRDPFAPGEIISGNVTAGGSGYTDITITVSSLTGSGAILKGVLVSGALVAIIVQDPGQNYLATDTVNITGSGGSGATATISVGPQTGTYPSIATYFQQRRVYGNSLNNPDTYWMSQPGAFTNFDSRIPTIDSDAITGSPWSLQVNGIQFMVPTAGGLLVFTGLANWLLVGTGSFATNVQPITPSTQVATPQPENGCSATVPPIKINYDVLYVSSKGSFYFDQPYQLYALSEPIDLTENSSHLFIGYTIREHAWCQQPYKLVWAVRDDGVLLSLTWLKQQEVSGWARHDTQGLFQSVCAVTEPPVDALYTAVQRFPGGNTAYMIERMDNRIWGSVDDCWCVDCGLSLPQPTPDATLTVSSATGLGACTGVTSLVGGQNYSGATSATVVDDNGNGPGAGAVLVLTIVGGVITGVAFSSQGTGYINPKLVIYDPSNNGSGASARITLDNSADFETNQAVFSLGNVGSVIRAGGGIATITSYVSPTHVVANISVPIAQVIPNSGGTPIPAASGNWTMTAPVSSVSGLRYLAGATVTGIADGNVITPRAVSATGVVMLDAPASNIVIGLGFQAQMQTINLDAGEPTVQGQRKKNAAVTARIEASRGIQAGANQPNGSTLSPPQLAPVWKNLNTVSDVAGEGNLFPAMPYNSNFTPLRTGDTRVPIEGGFATPGQVCFQQDYPLPMNILAVITEFLPGDVPQIKDPVKQG